MYKKGLACALAVMTLIGMTGCGQTATGKTENVGTIETKEASAESGDDVVEVEVLLTSWGTDLQDQENFVVQKILEDTGVKVKLSTFGNDDDRKTNLNLRLVGNTAPDVFQLGIADIDEMVSKGYLLNMDDYMDSMPHVKEIEETSGLVGLVDGCQYGIIKKPQIFQNGYWIRKDWLDKLGLPMPTTYDELFDTVETVMKSDPDGNGKDDTIGITGEKWGTIRPILAGYGVCEPKELLGKDGIVTASVYDPMYKEALEKVNELLDRGIIDNEFMALTNQLFVDKLTQGLPVVVQSHWCQFDKPALYGPIEEVNPDAEWVQLPELQGPGALAADGYDPTSAGAAFGVSASLANDEKKLEAVCKLLEYVSYGDGLNLVSYGLEGVHYNIEDGEPVATDKMATEADFTWLYQFLGRNEMEYLGVKFPYAKEDIDFAQGRKYIRLATSLATYPDWYRKADAERYLEEESIKFMFGERPLSEYDSFVQTLNDTYQYDKFVEGVKEEVGTIK